MLYKQKPVDEIIENVRNVGEMLVPYNFPLSPPPGPVDDLEIFKTTEFMVDGYSLVTHYQKGYYHDHFVETVQIYGQITPFLPFSVICKVAKKFLGSHELSLVEKFQDNRKIYCWSVCVDESGKPIPSPYDVEVEKCSYEGFNYLYMQPNQVNFF